MSRLSLWENSFENPVETSTYLPISPYVDRKRYLTSFLPIIMIFFQKRTSQLSLSDNSFGNLVETSTNSSISRHIDRKRYFKVIVTSVIFEKILL